MKKSYKCPICETDWGELNPIDSFEICSCGMHFGYYDATPDGVEARQDIYEKWRKAWLANGKQAPNDDQLLEVFNPDRDPS